MENRKTIEKINETEVVCLKDQQNCQAFSKTDQKRRRRIRIRLKLLTLEM